MQPVKTENKPCRTAAENTLVNMKDTITQLIPQSSFGRFREFVAHASLSNGNLNSATTASITQAFMSCAKTGLMPDGEEAAIVTRYSKSDGAHLASFQPMVAGVTRIINESEKIKSFHVKTVYKGDEFSTWSDEDGDHLQYRPSFDTERSDENIWLFYAVAKLQNGSTIIEVMTRGQVDKHKSLAKQKHIWNQWYSQMGEKTIIHKIIKRLPVSNPEIVKGLEQSLDLDLSGENQKLPEYTEDQFEDNMEAWQKAIQSGKRTPHQIIAMVETKYTLPESMKQSILNLDVAEAEYTEEQA